MTCYSRAPIAEAVIDLIFDFESAPDTERLRALAQHFSNRFPQRHAMNAVGMTIPLSQEAGEVQGSDAVSYGWRLSNENLTRVVQLRTNGVSYSHLKPYSNWETFAGEAREIFEAYIHACAPKTAERIAVRYINQIELPQGVDVADYLNISANVPDADGKLPVDITGYFMQMRIQQSDLGPGFEVIVNSGIGPATNPDQMALLLDLDVFVMRSAKPTIKSIYDTLNLLRDRKNQYFEAAITHSTREMIK